MSINTLSFVMFLIERTPLGLEVKQIEISIFFHLVDQPSLQFFRRMCKRAIVSILAFIEVFGVLCAILRLVFLWMVHRLHSV
jgi:hypothetical protein